jgi:DNA primase
MAGKITQECRNEIANKTDILALIGEYVQIIKKGSRWVARCPFHNEKTPSFTIDPVKNFYYCFGCKAKGDAFTFLQEMEKISFVESVQVLAKKAGVEIRFEGNYAPEQTQNTKNDEYVDLYTRVAGMFHYMLTVSDKGAGALAYIKKRGITDETISRFMLGYAPKTKSWLKTFLKSKHFSDDFLADSGLFSKNYPDTAFFQDRLIFPISDRQSRVVAFGGRLLSGDGPKYLNSSDLPFFHKGETLYAFNLAKQEIRIKKAVVVCEGYMDVLAYHQSGVKNAVAPLGTALTLEQIRLVKSFIETIYISFDSDAAGKKACEKAILLCRKEGLTVRVVEFSAGKDPAEIMQESGAEVLTKCVESAKIDCEYLLSVVKHDYPVDTPDGKTKAALAFFSYIDVLSTDMQKQSCLDLLAQTLNVSFEAVMNDYLNRDAARNRTEVKQPASQQAQTGHIKLNVELRTMLSVIANFRFFPEIRAALTADDFEDSLARDMFISLEECYRDDADSLSNILSKFEDKNVVELITDANITGEYSSYTLEAVRESIERIKKNSLERRRITVLNKLRQIIVVTLEDQQHQDTLLSELMSIDSELKQ